MYQAESDLKAYIAKVVEAKADLGYDGEVEGWDWEWHFPNVLLFTITIMTTIGYGHICPQTDGAKLFTIIYSLVNIILPLKSFPQFGMPLFMLFLGGVGETMGNALTYGYSRICCRFPCCNGNMKSTKIRRLRLKPSLVQDTDYMVEKTFH